MSTSKTVAPRDPVKRSSPVIFKTDGTATIVVDASANVCYRNDESFADGAGILIEGQEYECSYGNWVKVS
jgi:hypothetical protein